VDDATIRAFAPKAAILSGGPASTTEADAPRRRRPCWSLAAVAAMVDDDRAARSDRGG
jgi:GMP synthase-like glutamine amidotransferase